MDLIPLVSVVITFNYTNRLIINIFFRDCAGGADRKVRLFRGTLPLSVGGRGDLIEQLNVRIFGSTIMKSRLALAQ
jgi:hypothetical protein